MAHVATPVAVVTAFDRHGTAHGVTVGTLCSLSLVPPLIMFSISRSSRSHATLTTAANLLVNVLRASQAAVAARFSQVESDRFTGSGERWHGLPTIPGAAVRLACSRHDVVPGGDHTVIICRVRDAEVTAGEPLVYFARGYRTLDWVADE